MTKKAFIERMAEKGNMKFCEAESCTNLFLDTLKEAIKKEGFVKFVGLGNFEVKQTKERKGRNPKTGSECIIPKHKVVKFKASEKMINELNE